MVHPLTEAQLPERLHRLLHPVGFDYRFPELQSTDRAVMSVHDLSVDQAVYTRRRLLLAAIGVAVPAAVYAAFRDGDDGQTTSRPTAIMPTPGSLVPGDPAALAVAAPFATVPADAGNGADQAIIEFDHPVGPGSAGEKVVALQDRLRTLRFDPGPSDGVFGPSTERAVWAYEKFIEGVASDAVTGQVSPEQWQQLNLPAEIRPRRSNPGTHVEVFLPSQVAVVFSADKPVLITHVSTGTGEEWCDVVTVDEDDGTQSEKAICGVSVTPGGVFHFERRIEGWRESKLGRLYNPVYFNYGIAIHGASNVPSSPASRGCVRIPMHIAEYFPSLVANGDLVYVFDGVEQPETYGAQLPIFDYPDPNAPTTTSTSTSSTSAPTTSASSPGSESGTTTTLSQPSTTDHPHDSATTTAPPTPSSSASSTPVGDG